MTMEPTPPPALERARKVAEEALSGSSTDPALRAQRAQAKAAIEAENLPEPAKLTKTFAHVLDDLVQIPGTTVRIGVDPVLSLIPWAGTAVGAAFGSVVLLDAVRLRAPLPVIARMVANSVIDWLLGLVPFVGAFFDMAFRSNKKNLKLLHRTIDDRELVHKASVRYWIAVAVLMAVVLGTIISIPIVLIIGLDALLS